MDEEKKSNPSTKIQGMSEMSGAGNISVSVVSYTAQGRGGKVAYMVRGFAAAADICGDLELYSDSPITAEDTEIKKVFVSYRLDPSYTPTFRDAMLYGQILYDGKMYKAAAPVFETALGRLKESHEADQTTMKRVLTDQAGMAYGISGDLAKARSIFDKAITEDPGYPLYYYNLACADAEEKDLAGAQEHLREAFDRKANAIVGEKMPDPTTDDSFLPYRDNKVFWSFLQNLQAKPAAAKPGFSGDYAIHQKKTDKAITASLRVVQNESTVAVTRFYGGKSVTNRFPLDGSEGDYVTQTGARGKCKAHWNNEILILESLVASPAGANAPSIRFNTTEEWQLSADTKMLTIKTEIKSPDMPADVMTAAFPNNQNTEKYQRLDIR